MGGEYVPMLGGRGRLAAIVVLAMAAGLPAARSAVPAVDPQPQCEQEAPPPGAPVVAPGAGLRVATYNVLHTLTDESDATLDARIPLLAEAIASGGADVVGAQEVAKTANHGHVAERLAAELATRTGVTWHWCWFASNPHFPGEPDLQPGGGGGPATEVMAQHARSGETEFREGLAVLSRYPVVAAAVRRQPPRSYEAAACVPPDPIDCNAAAVFDSRSLLHARIDSPIGSVDLVTTHLAHGITQLSDTTKLVQAVTALRYADEVGGEGVATFLVGDFNSDEGSPVYERATAAGFVDTFRAVNPTAPGNTSDQDILAPASTVDHRIDYVFARSDGCPVVVAASRVIGDQPGSGPVWPSDHYGVVSDIACG